MTETISIFTYIKGFQQFETSYTAAVGLPGDHPAVGGGDAGVKEGRIVQMMTVRQRHALRTAVRLAAAAAITVLFLFPIYWLFMISFKTPEEIYSFPPKLVIRAGSIRQLRGAVQGRRRDHGMETVSWSPG